MPLSDFRSVFMPYCLARQPDGRYAVLNREYKPVGFATDRHVQYDQHPVLVRLPGLDPAVAKRVSHDGSPATDTIYLYNDGCVPTQSAAKLTAYLARLAVLASLRVG